MFKRSAAFYDAIYSFKDYAAEAEQILGWARQHGRGQGRLLDAACGTGRHAEYLSKSYAITGIDLDEGLLEHARRRLPQAEFLAGDMCTARFDKKFDVITCLFSAIGYLDPPQLQQACRNFYEHLETGGVVLIEPWLRPEMIRPGHVGIDQAEFEGIKLVRMSRLQIEGNVSICQFRYLIGTASEIRQESEDHRLTLFTLPEYQKALEDAGFEFHWDEQGLTGRGLLIGIK
ncbi:MAG: class I SAM-dependent methyltransferase [Candidatus Eremiobacteraeota bacterium]|nr:class I SAM-dependent methyltransferase [Candidatus Eremiobacteraeota bacterium]MCW5871128.1 class I SAM-dependent methyltransferase [Candidatus Eremiobacteraeota bacterium]